MIPDLDPVSGLLPRGRHVCRPEDVEAAFVKDPAFTGSATRADIWDHWNQALTVLQSSVTTHAAWIGGSFTTSKPDPGDIDVTFVINAADYRQRSAQDQQIVTLFARAGMVKSHLGLNVDSYVLSWECLPAVIPYRDPYFWERGYWDDWWQRVRQSPKGGPPVPADALPRRGYLEVLISDYTC